MAEVEASSAARAVPFVGRSSDLDAIARWFDGGARLVTLVGPGGIGKTALAAEYAAVRIASGDRSSAIFCDLSAARTAGEGSLAIADAVAAASGLEPGADIAQIGAAIAARGDVVVVLDDFEGLTDHAPATVGAWIAAAPEAEIVVTSRERLALVGEVVHEVGPLSASGAARSAEGAAPQSDGIAMLLAAAQRRAAGFALQETDAAAAREIVELLDGVPLALDMAGARIPLLGVRAVLEELRGSIATLRRDVRGGPERHASLDAAVRGSFESLDAVDRDVLAQLTVFCGGFTAEAVSAIVDVGGRGNAVESLGRLRDRSLVRMRDATEARFDLYAPVRAFVLRENPQPVGGAQARHAAWFVERGELAAERAHYDRRARVWLTRERENLLAVVRGVLVDGVTVTARTAEPALRALVALCPILLFSRRPLASMAAVVAPVVERTRDSGADPALTARAMLLRGALRREAGDVRLALKDLLGAESIARAVRDAVLEADVQVELGRALLVAREGDAAQRQLEKAAQAFGALGARAREAHALAWRARAHRGPPEAAARPTAVDERADPHARDVDAQPRRAWLERAVGLAAGEDALHGWLLLELADERIATLARGPAKKALSEALVVAVRARDPILEADARFRLGKILLDEDTPERASLDDADHELALARDLFEAQGMVVDAAFARGHLGLVARARGREGEACALLADARDAAIHAKRTEEARFFAERLDRSGAAPGSPGSARPAADALVVGEGGAWFRPPNGARVGLERRRNLALLLDRLARARDEVGGAPLASASLFEAAWPGEKALPHAAAHRVRVAVATLRKMGLADAIVTTPAGYAIAEAVPVARA